MEFKLSFCDPLKPVIIDLGVIPRDRIIETFEQIPWVGHLQKMGSADQNEIYFSPSFEIENTNTQHGLSISAVGEPEKFEFYIFYRRPKIIKYFFGLKEKTDPAYTSSVTGQTMQNAIECIHAFINNEINFLANTIGK